MLGERQLHAKHDEVDGADLDAHGCAARSCSRWFCNLIDRSCAARSCRREQGDPMDLDEGDGSLKALLQRVNKQDAEIALNGNMVKTLCAQGSRAEEQHAIL